MIDFSETSPDDFLAALRRGASHVWSVEAAVWLLEHHGVWLHDPRLRPYVDGGVEEDGTVWAGLPFRRVGDALEAGAFGEWNEDIAVLRIILSLWGHYPISLRYTGEYLTEANLTLVAKALFLANGYAEPHHLP
ncbi:hypothetical protein OG625_14290 [Streptomyces sp. NBC_01351]|uniref:hypothetical protein n=1 Tax=Streptomyces sp. NBC_01351 TaxID=2903833 RepID=UPI002E32C372|nr:hypothetical protein [Streptomyces sp. NBC_01351]